MGIIECPTSNYPNSIIQWDIKQANTYYQVCALNPSPIQYIAYLQIHLVNYTKSNDFNSSTISIMSNWFT